MKANIKNIQAADFEQKCIVIDASILLKLCLREEGYEFVAELIEMQKQKEMTILVTPLLIFEVLNVLAKITKDPDEANEAFKLISSAGFGTINPDEKFMQEAIKAACGNKQVSYYDASYHALAKDFDCMFLTADKQYYDAMKKEGNVILIH